MTPPLATVTGTHDVLAGFELSPGAVGLGGGWFHERRAHWLIGK